MRLLRPPVCAEGQPRRSGGVIPFLAEAFRILACAFTASLIGALGLIIQWNLGAPFGLYDAYMTVVSSIIGAFILMIFAAPIACLSAIFVRKLHAAGVRSLWRYVLAGAAIGVLGFVLSAELPVLIVSGLHLGLTVTDFRPAILAGCLFISAFAGAAGVVLYMLLWRGFKAFKAT